MKTEKKKFSWKNRNTINLNVKKKIEKNVNNN